MALRSGTTSSARLRIADWIDERVDEMAAQAVADIWNAVPAYRDSGLDEAVAEHCRQIFGLFTATMREGRDPEPVDFPWTAEHARRRVEAGIPLIDFLSAFRVGQRTLWAYLQEYGDTVGDAKDVLLGLVSHVMRIIETGSSAAATSYLEAQQHELADLQRVQRDVLEELLEGREPQGALRRRVLDAAGLDAGADFMMLVATPTSDDPTDDDAAAVAARTAYALAETGVFVARHRELLGLVPLRGRSETDVASAVQRITDELHARGTTMSVGLSASHPSYAAVPDAYREAELARDSLQGRPGLQSLSAVSPLTYLVRRPDPTVRRLIRPVVLSFFAEDLAGDAVYADTLEAYVAHDLSAREAARSMHVHVNTMYYRLERMASRTETDLRRFEAIVELLLAVQVLRSA